MVTADRIIVRAAICFACKEMLDSLLWTEPPLVTFCWKYAVLLKYLLPHSPIRESEECAGFLRRGLESVVCRVYGLTSFDFFSSQQVAVLALLQFMLFLTSRDRTL